ncbi:MAG: UvrD-helicase domain-containing protein [Muribaculaceae bacterium]|nr:UvrD-helicase domain-containing protein [Muribaculaceae bacterium]
MTKVSLNEKQSMAMEATEGRVRVVAGAGSGKTRVLAHRFAFIVNELGIAPGNVLCLTFTNKAAQEMKHRIASMVDRGDVNDLICTIHSFCVKLLRREIYRIGYPKNFIILDETDAKDLAKTAMQEFGIDRKKNTAERLLKNVAALKGYDPDGYIARYLMPGADENSPEVKIRYIQLQRKQFALDYDDIIYIATYILTHFADARKYWCEKLNYVMVDEVQDCSGDDWKLIEILASHHGNLFVVGDPDQAIYEWRGASPKTFVNFKADTDIILDVNYRSTPDILAVANSIISHNRNRVRKELTAVRLNERIPEWNHYKSETEEAEGIASTIEKGVIAGARFSDFAVLYRSSFMSLRLEQALLKRKIPYTVWGGVRFFERKEIKDIICYLRLTANEHDDMAFTRIINVPSRKFGSVTYGKLKKLAEAEADSLYPTLRRHIGDPAFGKKPVRDFIDLIEEAKSIAPGTKVSDLTDRLMKRSGLDTMYRTDEEEERLENVSQLVNSMLEFENKRFDEDEADLFHYLHEIALFTNSDHEKEKDKTRLMTIHQSKGLEFPNVFIMGLTEGSFPNHRSIRERRSDGEEEERRLMYVAVTRAKDMLRLSDSEGYLNDTGALKYPSRFISEIEPSLIKTVGNPDPSLLEGTKNMMRRLNEELGGGDESVMTTGTKVSHRVFGEGVVEGYDPVSKSYRVRFREKVRQMIPSVLKPV